MLQTQIEPAYELEAQSLDLRQYYAIAKKRFLYFLIPFILVVAGSIAAAMLWPPTYLSEGKILVESQQIPIELVRPTVSAAAKERIQVIQQRVTTRDNLLALVDKYGLYSDRRDRLSRTELLDLARENIKIESMELDQAGGPRNQTIALKVGFMDRRPDVATKVANELITLFLNEDARNRTNRAMETTRFLAREAQRLEGELAALESKIAEAVKQQRTMATGETLASQEPSMLARLRAEYAQKSAIYRATHPELRRITAQIEALEKVDQPPVAVSSGPRSAVAIPALDSLLVQRASLRNNLETANQKLTAARLGETLERDQFSERLEVLENAIPPSQPLKPNRLKIVAFGIFAAVMIGFVGVYMVESFDRTIRGRQDLVRVADSRLVVVLPYITTQAELSGKKLRWFITFAVFVLLVMGALLAVHFLVRPLDELTPILADRLMKAMPRW